MKITFLGTGTSHGVPAIDCMLTDYKNCAQGVCLEAQHDPKHVRTRCSLLVEVNGQSILIDTSQDFRMQMLSQQVKRIDAVLLTHSHADHIYGMPDIRSYCRDPEHPLRVYGSAETIKAIKKRFDYIFEPPDVRGGGIPELVTQVIEDQEPFTLFGLEITPARVEHGGLQGCFGYRLGNTAYVPDVKVMPEAAKAIFRGVDRLILNCLRIGPEHQTHLTLSASVALAQTLAVGQGYFVHMTHDIHYQKDQARLPDHITFAYDGLQIVV